MLVHSKISLTQVQRMAERETAKTAVQPTLSAIG